MDSGNGSMNNESIPTPTPPSPPSPSPDPVVRNTPTDKEYEQLIPTKTRSKYNEVRMLGRGPQNGELNSLVIDVTFEFELLEGQARRPRRVPCLWAHKFILLDGPYARYFKKYFLEKPPQVIFDVPASIKVGAVDKLLNHIYGKELGALGLEQENVDDFLDAAAFFEMDIYFLTQLFVHCSFLDLGFYVSKEFERLSTKAEFWNLDFKLIMQLCQRVDKNQVELQLLRWIQEDRSNRIGFCDNLLELIRSHLDPVTDPLISLSQREGEGVQSLVAENASSVMETESNGTDNNMEVGAEISDFSEDRKPLLSLLDPVSEPLISPSQAEGVQNLAAENASPVAVMENESNGTDMEVGADISDFSKDGKPLRSHLDLVCDPLISTSQREGCQSLVAKNASPVMENESNGTDTDMESGADISNFSEDRKLFRCAGVTDLEMAPASPKTSSSIITAPVPVYTKLEPLSSVLINSPVAKGTHTADSESEWPLPPDVEGCQLPLSSKVSKKKVKKMKSLNKSNQSEKVSKKIASGPKSVRKCSTGNKPTKYSNPRVIEEIINQVAANSTTEDAINRNEPQQGSSSVSSTTTAPRRSSRPRKSIVDDFGVYYFFDTNGNTDSPNGQKPKSSLSSKKRSNENPIETSTFKKKSKANWQWQHTIEELLQTVRNHIKKNKYNEEFLVSWKNLLQSMGPDRSPPSNLFSDRQNSIYSDVLNTLIESGKKFGQEPGLGRILRGMLVKLAKLKEYRSALFRADVVQFVLNQLNDSKAFQECFKVLMDLDETKEKEHYQRLLETICETYLGMCVNHEKTKEHLDIRTFAENLLKEIKIEKECQTSSSLSKTKMAPDDKNDANED